MRKVLIMDSCREFGERIIDEFKGSQDYTVVGFEADGGVGLRRIKAVNPDIVIMDIILPTLDGFSVLEEIKELNLKPTIIVVSRITAEEGIAKVLELGATSFIAKPIDPKVLVLRMKELTISHPIPTFNPIFATPYSKKPYTQKTVEEKISNVFIVVGIPAHIKGYQFLREAIRLTVESPDIINSITKKLYPTIADKYETSSSKVERAIRHAIEVAWNRGKIENINNLFGLKVYSSNEKPTNGEFIALVADKMLIEGA